MKSVCILLNALDLKWRIAVPDMISRQALLCHRVLRTFQNLVIHSTILEQETWDCLLLFLLAINDALLAPPTIPSILCPHLQ